MISISKISISTCIILCLIIFGIYSIYWEYLLMKNVHAIKKDNSSCTGEMLCLIFIPFYSLYRWFTRGKTIRDEFSKHTETFKPNSDFAVMAIMQNDFNSMPSEFTQPNQKNINVLFPDVPKATEGHITEEKYIETGKTKKRTKHAVAIVAPIVVILVELIIVLISLKD